MKHNNILIFYNNKLNNNSSNNLNNKSNKININSNKKIPKFKQDNINNNEAINLSNLNKEDLLPTNINDKNFDLNLKLPNLKHLDDKNIIKIYGPDKTINYGEIYGFLLSKDSSNRIWPQHLINIEETNKRNIAKNNFRKKCKKFFLNDNKRLCINTILRDCFNKSIIKMTSIIIEPKERINLIKSIHEGYSHIGINRLEYEMRRRGYYWKNLSNDVKDFVKACVVCNTNKANSYIKPNNK